MSGKTALYYDDTCNLCVGVVSRIARSSRAGAFELVPVSKRLPEGVEYSRAMRDIHAIDESGHTYVGADAVLHTLSRYPLLHPLAWVCSLPGMKHIARMLYRLVADYRHKVWGRVQK